MTRQELKYIQINRFPWYTLIRTKRLGKILSSTKFLRSKSCKNQEKKTFVEEDLWREREREREREEKSVKHFFYYSRNWEFLPSKLQIP